MDGNPFFFFSSSEGWLPQHKVAELRRLASGSLGTHRSWGLYFGEFMQRRKFLASATALGALSAVDVTFPRVTSAAVIRQRAARPIIVSSSNGNWFKNGGDKNCVQLAYEKMVQGPD